MPPPVKKDVAVILFDVATHSKFHEKAYSTLMEICWNKYFSGSKDLSKLILLNADKTDNCLNDSLASKCKNVVEVTRNLILYNPVMYSKAIEDTKPATSGNWLNAILVAIETFKEAAEDKGAITLQLLLFTDFSLGGNLQPNAIEYVINALNSLDIYLYVLGPKVYVPEILTDIDQIFNWSKNLQLEDHFKELEDAKVAKDLVQKTRGIVCDLQLGKDLFFVYKKYKDPMKFKEPLVVGSTVEFPTISFRFLTDLPPIKISAEEGEKTYDWKWVKKEDISQDVAHEDVIGGLAKYGKFVALEGLTFKYEGERCFKLLGFVKLRDIPEIYWIGEGSNMVKADETVDENDEYVQGLAQILREKKMCIIARRVYMRNTVPKLMVLIPAKDRNHFIMNELPYVHEVKKKYKETPRPPPVKKDTKKAKTFYKFLDQLSVSRTSRIPLAPQFREDILRTNLFKRCAQKCLEEEIQWTRAPIPELDVDLVDAETFESASTLLLDRKEEDE